MFPRWHFPMAVTVRRMIFWSSFSGWTRSSPALSAGAHRRGTARYNANPNLALHYDDNDNWPPRSPVAMWFDDTILDDFLKDWATVQKKLYAGEITQAEYFEWKIMWPDCDNLHI